MRMTPVERDHSAGLNGAVAAVLRGERAAAGKTIEELADESGVNAVSLQRYLQAKRAIDVDVLESVAHALGTSSIDVIAQAEARLKRTRAARNPGRPGSNASNDED